MGDHAQWRAVRGRKRAAFSAVGQGELVRYRAGKIYPGARVNGGSRRLRRRQAGHLWVCYAFGCQPPEKICLSGNCILTHLMGDKAAILSLFAPAFQCRAETSLHLARSGDDLVKLGELCFRLATPAGEQGLSSVGWRKQGGNLGQAETGRLGEDDQFQLRESFRIVTALASVCAA